MKTDLRPVKSDTGFLDSDGTIIPALSRFLNSFSGLCVEQVYCLDDKQGEGRSEPSLFLINIIAIKDGSIRLSF